MKPEWWTNGKACSRIPRVIELWREQGCEVTPLYGDRALLEAEQRGRRQGMEEAIKAIQDELENLTSHDPGICLDMVLRALQAKLDEVQP